MSDGISTGCVIIGVNCTVDNCENTIVIGQHLTVTGESNAIIFGTDSNHVRLTRGGMECVGNADLARLVAVNAIHAAIKKSNAAKWTTLGGLEQ